MKYVLITPVRNEGAFIKMTLDSVLAQTIPPERGLLLMMDLPIIPQRLLLHLQSKFRGSNSSDANSGSIETSQARFILWVLYFHMAKRITISEAHLSGRYLG